jgi:hypothetical protein
MEAESVWRSRLAWRLKGALLWPTFVVLTFVDALLLQVLPIAGDGATPFIGALLLAAVFNLIMVAVVGPLLAVPLRRRRPDLPKVVAQDHTGTALVCCVTLALLAGGLLHAPARAEAERDLQAQAVAARDYAHTRAPEQFRDGTGSMTSIKLDDDLYRTCVPGDDPKRWFCMIVSTETSPPGITVDGNRESNESMNRFGAYRR